SSPSASPAASPDAQLCSAPPVRVAPAQAAQPARSVAHASDNRIRRVGGQTGNRWWQDAGDWCSTLSPEDLSMTATETVQQEEFLSVPAAALRAGRCADEVRRSIRRDPRVAALVRMLGGRRCIAAADLDKLRELVPVR